jgi:hypothetical protein
MTASTPVSHHETAASIVAAVRTGLPGLVDRIVARIRSEIPFYATRDVVSPDDLRASVRANIEFILDSLTGPAQANLSAPHATGRTRAAQGAPLAEMLTAYRLGVTELWSALVATARGMPGVPAGDVVDLAGMVFAVQNTYSDAALAAYRDESREILRTRERERAAMVEVILASTVAKGTLWEVASALRLPLDGAFLVVAAETGPGHDPVPRAESALAVVDVRSVWRLDAELSLGVLSLPDRSRNETVLSVLNRHATGRIGASPVFGELHQASWALQLARLALDSHPRSPGVAQFRDSPIDILVGAAPHAALETARLVLGGLLALPEDELDLLLGTFEAWVRASGSANAAGSELFCHPNTVRYRLRRIEAGTGRTLSHPSDVAELVTAVRAWRELPHTAGLRVVPAPVHHLLRVAGGRLEAGLVQHDADQRLAAARGLEQQAGPGCLRVPGLDPGRARVTADQRVRRLPVERRVQSALGRELVARWPADIAQAHGGPTSYPERIVATPALSSPTA